MHQFANVWAMPCLALNGWRSHPEERTQRKQLRGRPVEPATLARPSRRMKEMKTDHKSSDMIAISIKSAVGQNENDCAKHNS